MKKLGLMLVVVLLSVSFVAAASADEAYKIDGDKYVALRDHYLLVNLDDDITVGFIVKKGSWFNTAEMDALSRGWDDCSGDVYKKAIQKRTAKGANSVVIMTKRLIAEIKEIKADYAAGRDAKKRNPDLAEHLKRTVERTAKREGDRLIEDLTHEFVRDLIRKNMRW